jgi:hypothetical protein
MPLPTAEQIGKARRKADQAKARLQALEARLNQAARKLDTRRKIILGGLLLDAAAKDAEFAGLVAVLLRRISREHDRKAFEGWSLISPPGADGNGAGPAPPAPRFSGVAPHSPAELPLLASAAAPEAPAP